MFALMVDRPADVMPQGGSQCIPLYVYRRLEDGAEALPVETLVVLDGARYARRDNLTDWALGQFQDRYAAEARPNPPLPGGSLRSQARKAVPLDEGDSLDARRHSGRIPRGARGQTGGSARTEALTKADVFHYVYAVLHHPAYRARYAADLKRSLPRVPFAPTFWGLAHAGRALAALHVGFETAAEFPLETVHTPGTPLTYRVEKMVLDEAAGTLRLNDSLTLAGIPAEAHAYRLGNRTALAWLVDQLRVKTDTRSGIVHDPNDAADPERIARLVRQVTMVSVETARIVEALPELGLPEA